MYPSLEQGVVNKPSSIKNQTIEMVQICPLIRKHSNKNTKKLYLGERAKHTSREATLCLHDLSSCFVQGPLTLSIAY